MHLRSLQASELTQDAAYAQCMHASLVVPPRICGRKTRFFRIQIMQ